MRRVWRHVIAGLAVLGGGGALAAACAHDDSTIFVLDVLAPKLTTPGQLCTYTPDPTQLGITSGVLDVTVSREYEGVFLVGNQMVPRGNPNGPSTETSYVHLEGAVVRITDTGGNQLTTFTRISANTIPPAQGGIPSYVPMFATIVDQGTASSPGVAQAIASNGTHRLITYTKFFGHTLGGQYVESGEFAFPVDLCAACLIPNCSNASAANQQSQVPCILGQDALLSCGQLAMPDAGMDAATD